jgi:hypothetical protein
MGLNFESYRWIALKSLQEFRDAFFLGVDVASPLGQVEVASLEISVSLDRPQIFTRVSGRLFPWTRCEIATRTVGGRVARDQRTGLKGP